MFNINNDHTAPPGALFPLLRSGLCVRRYTCRGLERMVAIQSQRFTLSIRHHAELSWITARHLARLSWIMLPVPLHDLTRELAGEMPFFPRSWPLFPCRENVT